MTISYKQIRSSLQTRQKAEDKRLEQVRLDVFHNVLLLIQKYLREYPQTEVYLFGSVLETGKFHDNSDIDIAIKNLQESRLDLYARWSTELKREIDIVLLEKCDFAEDIYLRGLRVEKEED